MIIKGFSLEEQERLRETIGVADPDNRLEVRSLSEGMCVLDIKPVKGKGGMPLKLKAFPCLTFQELLKAVEDAKTFLSA